MTAAFPEIFGDCLVEIRHLVQSRIFAYVITMSHDGSVSRLQVLNRVWLVRIAERMIFNFFGQNYKQFISHAEAKKEYKQA